MDIQLNNTNMEHTLIIDQVRELYQHYWSILTNMTNAELGEQLFQAFIVITGILGQVLIIRKNIGGFVVWIISNVALVWGSFEKGYIGMGFLYIFYTFMCFYGIKEWRTKKEITPIGSQPFIEEQFNKKT